jgi:uncharacterized protein (TIGR03000 family)
MFQKTLSFAGTLLLTGTALLLTPGLGHAQHGGGSHGGGGHFAGGGAHLAGGSGHYSGGGFHGSMSMYGGGARYEGYRGSIYGNHSLYGGYGFFPYYGLYGSYPYYDSYPYGYGDETPSYADSYPNVTAPAASYQALYPATTAEPDAVAHLTVSVPAGALLWINGSATTSTGPFRYFDSPPLTAGSHYSYEVQARWNENGHDVTQTQSVAVTAGVHVSVSFPVPPKTAG